jgi:hypothetical protein
MTLESLFEMMNTMTPVVLDVDQFLSMGSFDCGMLCQPNHPFIQIDIVHDIKSMKSWHVFNWKQGMQ